MGIPQFYRWLERKKFPHVIVPSLEKNIDWLIFDMNSLLHEAQQRVYGYGEYYSEERAAKIKELSSAQLELEFFNTVVTLIQNAVTLVLPREGIFMAIDGVAPIAKMQQQKQRRYISKRVSNHQLPIDVSRITPGTELMVRLDKFLKSWLEKEKETNRMAVPRIVYSSHLVPGEGEHKYLEMLRDGTIPSTGKHVIYGLDNDLFILALISPVENIYVTRKDIEAVVNINYLRYHLHQYMVTKTSIQDFMLLTFFRGNDFLPRQPSMTNIDTGLDTLLRNYRELRLPLTRLSDGSIIFPNLKKLFEKMAAVEADLIAESTIRGFHYPSPTFEKPLITETDPERNETHHTYQINLFYKYWHERIFQPKDRILASDLDLNLQINIPAGINAMMQEYLRALDWNVRYYLYGWQYLDLYYYYPYHYTPTFKDLESFSVDQFQIEWNPQLFSIHPYHQLVAVLPAESFSLLPKQFQVLLETDSSILDLFPDDFLIDREGVKVSHEGVALLPPIEIDRIVAAVNTLKISRKAWELLEPTQPIEYKANHEADVEMNRRRMEQPRLIEQLKKKRRR